MTLLSKVQSRGGPVPRRPHRISAGVPAAPPLAPSNCITLEARKDEVFLTSRELAKRWSCAAKTLANRRSLGEGCTYFRIGGLVRYRLSDVLAFEATSSQSDLAGGEAFL